MVHDHGEDWSSVPLRMSTHLRGYPRRVATLSDLAPLTRLSPVAR